MCCTPQGTPEQSLQPRSQSLGTQNCSAGGTLLPLQLCTETGKGLRGLLCLLSGGGSRQGGGSGPLQLAHEVLSHEPGHAACRLHLCRREEM